jgi:hypothetical protein
MTSFNLLNFKFTQIFLMGQNSFLKMTELSVNVTELSVDSIEFYFSGDYCSFHTLNGTRLNFSEFH